jgi:hypothetical protein
VSYKNLPLSTAQKQALKDYAWRERLSMSQIIRQIIDDYANGEDLALPVNPGFETDIKYLAPDSYGTALARAKKDRLALSDVIRRELVRRIGE